MIGQVARRTGVPASTLRYWERERLLPAVPRVSGRRVYGPGIDVQVALVRAALALGFSVRELRELLRKSAAGGFRRATRKAATGRLRAVDQELAHAQKARAHLLELLACECRNLAGCVLVQRSLRSAEASQGTTTLHRRTRGTLRGAK